jgi:hypothetical protein
VKIAGRRKNLYNLRGYSGKKDCCRERSYFGNSVTKYKSSGFGYIRITTGFGEESMEHYVARVADCGVWR